MPGADSPDAAWDLMLSGGQAITAAPDERWKTRQRIAEQKNARVQSLPKLGGYLDRIDAFDAAFFGISAREARLIDPQQRLLLQTSWQAIEAGGFDPNDFKGTNTGVFVGVSTFDYLQRQLLDTEMLEVDAYSGLGAAHSIAANRISHFFDFNGPSLAVDTACSSASVALHLARQSLLDGECDHALVGGVNVIVSPLSTISFSKARMLAPDGRCKSFDAKADGYVRSEGCVVVLLSREDVLRDRGQAARAWITGSAVNQDGRTLSITTPNGAMQSAVVEAALENAGLATAEIDFLEAHGTGTKVGDRIELDALQAVFSGPPRPKGPVLIGAAKPHFGHLEAASGLLGVMKVVKSLEARAVPGLAFLDQPIEIGADAGIRLPRETTLLEAKPGPLRAGVSCFGFGGTNAHIVVEEARPAPHQAARQAPGPKVLPISSHSAETFAQTVADYRDLVDQTPALDLDGLCASAARRRAGHALRQAVVFDGRDDLLARLDAMVARKSPEPAGTQRKLAFCFSGQGGQFPGMCADLFAAVPTFREVLETCDAASRDRGGPAILEAILATDAEAAARLEDTAVAQPALFATGLALARAWEAMGVRPDVLVGHSLGEITAASFAGVMDLDTAMTLVLARARMMAAAPGRGGMLALTGPGAAVAQFVGEIAAPYPEVSVSGRNAPGSVTLSGPVADIARIEALAAAAPDLKAARLAVSAAFHSAQMEPVLEPFRAEIANLTFNAPRIPIVSTVSAAVVDADAPMDAAYWTRQIREPVDFEGAIRALQADDPGCVVEIGPRPILSAWLHGLNDETRPYAVVPALKANRDTRTGFLTGLAAAYARGAAVDWSRLLPAAALGRPVDLPPYRFGTARYWFEFGTGTVPAPAEPDAPGGGSDAVLRFDFDRAGVRDLLEQHVVRGRPVVPGALYVDLMLRAARSLAGRAQVELEDSALPDMVPLADTDGARLLVSALKLQERVWDLVVTFEKTGDRAPRIVAHARATAPTNGEQSAGSQQPAPLAGAVARRADDFYTALADSGLQYGAAFRLVDRLAAVPGRAEAWVGAPEVAALGGAALNPCQLDGGFQVVAAALQSVDGGDTAGAWVPTGFGRLVLHRPLPTEARVQASLVDGPLFPDRKSFDLSFFDGEGRLCLSLRDFQIQRIGSAPGLPSATGPLFALAETALPMAPGAADAWHEGWDIHALTPGDLADRLAALLDDSGRNANGAGASPAAALVVLDFAGGDCAEPLVLAETALALLKSLEADGGLARVVALFRPAERGDAGSEIAAEAVQAAVRVLTNESPRLRATNLVVAPGAEAADIAAAVKAAVARPDESDLIWRDGALKTLRLDPVAPPERPWSPAPASTGERTLDPGMKPGISNLAVVPMACPAMGDDDVLIAPQAAGLNFRDVLKALKQYPNRPGQSLWMGDECAGVVRALGQNVTGLSIGDRVMAVAPRAFSTMVVAPRAAVVPIPAGIEPEAAATIPIAFTTAWYGLVDLAGLSRGETVLIHAAAGGVGLAAVQIAQHLGARIIATAGSEEKRAYLAGLGIETIGNSRDLGFVDTVMHATDGQGVDVVLNSLAGPALEASLGLLRPFGRFVDIGKRDIVENRGLRMRPFHRSVSFHTLDMELLFGLAPEKAGRVLAEVAGAVSAGQLSALPRKVFALDAAAEAFQYMAGARNIGKVVLTIPGIARDKAGHPPVAAPPVASALITGAFGDIGLALARQLADAGVNGLVMVGRSGPGPAAADVLAALEARGVRLLSCAADVGDEEAMAGVFARADAAGLDIVHLFHGAGVLADGVIADLDAGALARAWRPKVEGARVLDRLTRSRNIQSFVCLSSVATVLGSPGQAAYAMANAGVDALCRARAGENLPAVSINLGPWQGGMAKASPGTADRFERLGLRSFTPTDGLATLFKAIGGDTPNLVAARFAPRVADQPPPPVAGLPVCRDLYPSRSAPGSQARGPTSAILSNLVAADPGHRPSVLETYLANKLGAVLGLGMEEIDRNRSLVDTGFDSLAGLEFGMMVEEETGVALPMDAIDAETSLSGLARLLLPQINLDQPADSPQDDAPRAGLPTPDPAPGPALANASPTAAQAGYPPDELADLPEPSAADYARFVRPDFTRLLPLLDLDMDYIHARGDVLTAVDESGQAREVLDFVGGYGSCLLGHNHPKVRHAAISALATERPIHAQGAVRGLSGTLARRLNETLAGETGDEYAVAFANSGSEAIEGALKHAVLEYIEKAKCAGLDVSDPQSVAGNEPVFLAIEGSYHGKTLAALSIGRLAYWRKAPFGLSVQTIPRNDPVAARKIVDGLMRTRSGKPFSLAAGLFVEPVQGEGGIQPLDPGFLKTLRALADEHGFPLVLDEIQSGFYRCGPFAAATGSDVVGDYYTFGKSLGGGIAKISALMIRRRRYQPGFGILNSSTFAEDDFSARAALAALDVAQSEDLASRVPQVGARLRARLDRLARDYPDVVREVRGVGLMQGLEINGDRAFPSGVLRSAAAQRLLGPLVCSFLLARFNIRVATPLSSPDTLRLQPSAFVSDHQLDAFVEALEAALVALRDCDGAYLVSHLLDKASWLAESVDCRDNPLPAPLAPAREDTRKVGFLIHVADDERLLRWDPSWARLTEADRQDLNARFAPLSRPEPVQIARIVTASGLAVEVHFKSVFASTRTIEAAMRSGESQWIVDQVQGAVDAFADDGCLAVGLGGFLSIATHNGRRVDDSRIGVTTGNALTVAASVVGLQRAIGRHLGNRPAKIGVVGANGNIGQTVARRIAPEFSELTLFGRAGSRNRLENLAATLHRDAARHGASTRVSVSDSLDPLRDCNVIVTATNSPEPIIFPHHLGPGPKVILDVSVPSDIAPAVARDRDDVQIIHGSRVTLPPDNTMLFEQFGLADQTVFACMAETALLGLDGRGTSFSRGDVTLEQVASIASLAEIHGFGLN
ncbi:hypothetical protein GCM10011358_17750 [Sinisalibacter lacisalsi]|uniref:Polyketide synthase n=1 Tax=Sinisalibacter lacisalsi TaxID=1526570 RepID=A0ABQ1QLV0_9RHOB|nr:hypothetical protein GCM10011358_17750 [Sinisalibacter lacisalsi]